MAMDRYRTLKAYERAWAQSDEAQIRAWLTQCWTITSTYVNAFTDTVSGLDGLTRLILDYPVLFPDAQFTPSGEQDAHHQHARYCWRLSSTARIRILGKLTTTCGWTIPAWEHWSTTMICTALLR